MHDASVHFLSLAASPNRLVALRLNLDKLNFFFEFCKLVLKKSGENGAKNKGGLQMPGVRTLAAFVPGMKARPWSLSKRPAPPRDTRPG
jgi:hypothetical protein